MSKRGIGYVVFGNPKGFEAKGIGLFSQIKGLENELYLGSSEFSVQMGEQVDGLIGLQVPDIGPLCIWGRWAAAKGVDSDRSGGWRGAAVVVAGSQPNWTRAEEHLDDLFRQIGGQCDARGHFRTGKDDWQIRFPELIESDLSSVPLEIMDGQSAQVAVALHGSQDLTRAIELGMSSMGRGVPRRWFFASPQVIERAKQNGAGFKVVLGFPGLMAHFLDSMGQKQLALDSKLSEVQEGKARLAERETELREMEGRLKLENQSLSNGQADLRQAQDAWSLKLDEKGQELTGWHQRIEDAKKQLDGLRQQGAPALKALKDAEESAREKGKRDGMAKMNAIWIGRAKVAGLVAMSLLLTALVFGVYAFFFQNRAKPAPRAGCIYENAINYNPRAKVDNGTCLFDQPDPGQEPVEESSAQPVVDQNGGPQKGPSENEDAIAAKKLRRIIGVLSDHDTAFDQASDKKKEDILKRRERAIGQLSSYVNLNIKPQIGLLFRVLSKNSLKSLQWDQLKFPNGKMQKELEENGLKVEWNEMVQDLKRSPGFQSKMKLSEAKKEAFPDDPDVNSWTSYQDRILIALKGPLETTGLPEQGNWRWRYLEGWNYNDVDRDVVEKRGYDKGMSAFAFRDFQADK